MLKNVYQINNKISRWIDSLITYRSSDDSAECKSSQAWSSVLHRRGFSDHSKCNSEEASTKTWKNVLNIFYIHNSIVKSCCKCYCNSNKYVCSSEFITKFSFLSTDEGYWVSLALIQNFQNNKNNIYLQPFK